jgi:outer membrane lipoprotein SlyB
MKKIALFSAIVILTGCAATGEQYGANVYKAGQVNSAQSVQMVNVLGLVPAKIEVDNSKNKQNAQAAGALIGAILGAAAANKNSSANSRANNTGAGMAAGGVVGGVLGSGVSDKTLVDGVTITYKLNNQMLSSTQVGKICEFKVGDAMMVSTNSNETRIQPNYPEGCAKK